MMGNTKWNERLAGSLDAYRPITFWSWNAKLEEPRLRRQIAEMKEAGMGGFFMHARSGLKTAYMEDDWFEAVRISMEEANRQKMQAWCYDENGWPSGFAGMKLLENRENLAHYITFEEKEVFDDTALAVYTLEENRLVRLRHGEDKAACYYTIYDKVNSSVVDILNERIVREFIELTHEKYYDRFGSKFGNQLVGFFTDEPQYFRYDTPYSPVLPELYAAMYHEDLLDGLAALFLDCKDCYKFRYRYWKMLNDQFVHSFAEQVYQWCEEHHCRLTGHVVEESKLHMQLWCCAGVMPFYEYEHIPGCDWLGRDIHTELTPKQVGSAAQQLGKKQVLTESFACTGWDVTTRELKRILEWQYVNGVNLLCTHLTPYSLEGNRKFDHPTFFSKANPWFEQFREFCDYTARLGCMLSESREYAPVGVIHPMHSAYLTYRRREDYLSVKELEDSFSGLIEQLGASNIPHHYIDETMLGRHGEVCGKELRVGLCRYESIVVPDMQQLDQTTVDFLREYLENGGKVWLAGERPSYVNGELANLDFLESNITFEELRPEQYWIETDSDSVRSTFHRSEDGDFLFLVNLSMEQDVELEVSVKAKGAVRLFLEDNHCEGLEFFQEREYIKVPLRLGAGESAILIMEDASFEKEERFCAHGITFSEPIVTDCSPNSLPLDYVQISYDDVTYTERMPVQAAEDYLLCRCENREIYLKYTFDVTECPESLILEMENMKARELRLNGALIELKEAGILDEDFISGNILPFVKQGENALVIRIFYFQKEHVYDVLYRTPDVTESLINCLTYDTEISAVYLRGQFGIYSKEPMKQTRGQMYLLDSPVAVGKTCRLKMQDLTGNGYPFFAGKVVFEMEAGAEQPGDIRLHLKGRFASARVKWNEYETDVVLSEHILIPGMYVKQMNKVTVTMFSGNRNLLGPHHWADELEPKMVMPTHFDFRKRWKDGKCRDYRDSYSLVRFGMEVQTEEF